MQTDQSTILISIKSMPGEIRQTETTLDDIAGMIGRGFSEVREDFSVRFTKLEKRFDVFEEKTDKRLDTV